MPMNHTILRELCARISSGDAEARRDFDRYVVPRVRLIVAGWLGRRPPEAASERPARHASNSGTVSRLTHFVCARMIAAAAKDMPHSECAAISSSAAELTIRETRFARANDDTVSQPAFRPA